MTNAIRDIDQLLDVMADLDLGKSRNKNFERNLSKGDCCEVCGKLLKTVAAQIECEVSGGTLKIGSECLKKIEKAGYTIG